MADVLARMIGLTKQIAMLEERIKASDTKLDHIEEQINNLSHILAGIALDIGKMQLDQMKK